MKLIDNKLYLEISEMVSLGISERYLWKAKSTGTKCWDFIKDPSDQRKVLIGYDLLKEEYKKMVQQRYGNPYDYAAKEPLRKLVKHDHKAQEYFLSYRYDTDKHLPIDHVNKYVRAASWLNMLIEVNADKKAIKKTLQLTLDQFWLNVCEIIKIDQINLPSTYQRLRNKMMEYAKNGYESLVDRRFGNKLAAKVSDEISESVLLKMIENPNQHDDVIIANAYNNWAAQNGYKTIVPATVGIHRRKNYFKLQAAREGNAAWYNRYGKIIHRNRPSAPLLLLNSDDNDLDLYFTEVKYDDGKKKTNEYFRFKLIVVIDAYNDYILGYSYAKTVTIPLIKAAYLDAIHHIKQLTGGWYFPDSLQTDRFGIDNKLSGDLGQFYKSLGTTIPATVKNARAKYIEQAFGKKWHQMLKMYPNYAGSNITSQFRINRDNLDIVKKDFPSVEAGYQHIEDFIERLRQLPGKDGIPRQQQWLNAFHSSELSQQHRVSEAKMLATLGTKHYVASAPDPEYPNTITNGGIKVTINGATHVYDIPDEYYLQNVGKKVQVIYDPYDTSRVLVTDGQSLRFVAKEFDKMSSAIADYAPGERSKLNNYLEEKRKHVAMIAAAREERKQVVSRHAIESESLLQAQVMTKEVKQLAEMNYQRVQIDRNSYNPLDEM